MHCSQLQSITANCKQWRQRRYIQLKGLCSPPLTGQYLMSSTFMVQMRPQSQDLPQAVGREHSTFGMPSQRTAYTATQGS